jgi:hypothetical protein
MTGRIRLAVALIAVRALLGLAAAVAQVGHGDRVRAAIAFRNPPLDGAQVATVYHGVLAVTLLASLGYVVLYAGLIVQVWRDRRWARNTARLLAALSALSALGSLREAAPPVSHPLAATILCVDLAILAALSLPAQRSTAAAAAG